MKTAVIYKSHYGATEIYAKWLSEDLGADLLQADKVKLSVLQQYDIIVYGGGLYAGGVNGIALLTKNFEQLQNKKLYLFTVGAADVTAPENVQGIRSALEQRLPPALFQQMHVYHLRGGMCYSKMNFIHRNMMKMMIGMLKKKPHNELRAEDKTMLDTYGHDIDFTNREAIAPLVTVIKASTTPQPRQPVIF